MNILLKILTASKRTQTMYHIVTVTITALLLVFLNRQGAAGISIITILVLRLILKTFPSTFPVCQLCLGKVPVHKKRERKREKKMLTSSPVVLTALRNFKLSINFPFGKC